ncbi:unnamed protein product [Moneuplotes crassus]|uniref:DNA-(apurinic or apyrimidinic site) endonuclease n=1 Tax=Euplotes crassus TaxID=5936 RepID=A0AAD1UST0_EUPCR|nr:unnamed protein product [Moneuplotes crassus]
MSRKRTYKNFEESKYGSKNTTTSTKETQKKKSQAMLQRFFKSNVEEVKFKDDFEQEDIKIWAWNINGIRAFLTKGVLKTFLEQHTPDILCLYETKIDQDTLLKMNIKKYFPKEYYQVWNCCKPPRKGYSGTAVFVKGVKPLRISKDFGTHNKEGRCITLEFEKFYLVSTYVPNSGQGLKRLSYRVEEWDADLTKHLKRLEEKGKPVIWCGDLNVAHEEIDIHDPIGNKSNPGFSDEERKSFSNILEQGFVDTFRHLNPTEKKYTYWSVRKNLRSTNDGWRIDYFVTSKSMIDQVIQSEIHDEILGSDHCPISMDLKLEPERKSFNSDENQDEDSHPVSSLILKFDESKFEDNSDK